jgi:acyl-coenzyme A thioesterase PaaI-like protein
VDYEALKAGLGEAIPFVKFLELEYVEVGPGRAVVRLPDRPELANHVGSQHAGALFTAAETASGAAFVGGFADRLAQITPLARSATIDYVKIAKGPIDATATLRDAISSLLATLDAEGKVEFGIDVELTDGDGKKVATAAVDWHVRSNT